MSSASYQAKPGGQARAGSTSFFQALRIQMRVIGAVIMRELHTRYGRDNIGYLWMIGEPMMLATVIGSLHLFEGAHSPGGGGFNPVTFAVVGYTSFIVFRGIVNRSAGTLESNQPLLYHHMVTILDIVIARTILETIGVFFTFVVLYSLLMLIGYAEAPARPLCILAGFGCVAWISFAISMIITGYTYEKATMERLVHVFTYFSMPVSGAFTSLAWVPKTFRGYLMLNPMASMFELIRYGVFEGATNEYVNVPYMIGFTLFLTLIGLAALRSVRHHITF